MPGRLFGKTAVERLIEEAAREGATELDLSGQRLTELPDSIGQLANLQSLNLRENQLTSLPESIGQLANLQSLDLKGNRLASLPDSIGQLASLQSLNLWQNQLTSLPDSIGQLANLQSLNLSANQLTSLPDSIGQLASLQLLNLDQNQLTSLPDSIGQLANLQSLYLRRSQLTSLPDSIGQLADLHLLALSASQLTSLPDSIGQLANLQSLVLDQNQLTSLPVSLAGLKNLQVLWLQGNPLDPALESAADAGPDELRAYLRSLEEPGRREQLYEAKLVLVGEGGVGKTTLLKAITGQEPREGEPTTHGVSIDIQSLRLAHPEKDGVEIRLNAWDFGGQEVYRVTHQFFFSRRSVYLLVWEPRLGVQQSQVEDWLKIIRLRVGDDARVIIVSTHCRTGGRIARIDKHVFQRDYGSMIAGFHEVDSLVEDADSGEKVGVAELKESIVDAAKDLEQTGMDFNRDWREARDEVLAIEKPLVAYAEFAEVCQTHGLDAIATRTLAELMHDLGYIVYYWDDERLRDDVVLRPEWLTKAIGFVLEDRSTQEMDGLLPDGRLKAVWQDHPFEGETRYPPALYPFFLRLMEKYDVSYRLREGNASLVAQHVPQVRPDLPWLPHEEPSEDLRRIAVICVMDEAPPGLVPWMTVRTHDYIHEQEDSEGTRHRLHWQRGMFLWNKSHGQAMLELRGREFHVYVEALWPEFFINLLRKTIEKLITDNWPGLEGRYHFAVPCRGRVAGAACDGRFRIEALRKFMSDGDRTIRCQTCLEIQDMVALLYDFELEDPRRELAHIESKIDLGFEEMRAGFAGLESRMANHVMAMMEAVASESKDGPRLFTIEPADNNWKRLVAKRYLLHLWCEAEGCQHPVDEEGLGVYPYDARREWVERVAPYANLVAGLLRTVLPVAAPAANVLFGAGTVDQLGIKNHLDVMKSATATLLKGDLDVPGPSRLGEGLLTGPERSGVLALHSVLRDLDRDHQRLGLKRVPTFTGDYLWLCETHFQQTQSEIPDEIT